ncbi:glycine/sarcosine/betaine reductase selenoprotein B family protein [Candidatus Poriferisodalis sp.]|uniref:glycine/sarcosine/betaine reductase selenoprotein B family protein n=1 Tax=Candidatus Poriferisodalis sp. TaxID=3101277 RepID=UPI003B01E567
MSATATTAVAARKPPVDYIPRITAQYVGLGYGEYRWVHSEIPPPWAPLAKPMSQCRLGLIATGGVYAAGQTAFHYRDDTTYRAIPTDVDTAQLRATHFAYDLTDARADINCVFPIDALRALRDSGEIGELGPNAYTLMGGIYSTRRVREELIPELAKRCLADELDAVLLVPV